MKTQGSYAARIQRVVDYVAQHLDDTLDLDTMARVAHLSPYHFHRVYRGVVGETAGDTVRRLRLDRAAIDLLDRDRSIERVARRAGYGSQAAFSRAFQAEYGAPPARYRGAREVAGLESATNANLYRVETAVLPPLRVAAIHQRGDYQLATQAFERLTIAAATRGLLSAHTRTFGIFHDDPVAVPQEELRATACITVPDDWTPSSGELAEVHIEGGRYARIVYTGPYTELKTAYDWLYQTWLLESSAEPRDLPCVEEYLNDPRHVPAKDLQTALMMPLEA